MGRFCLLIGLLTYSSLGWTETLIMECFTERDKHSLGIYKLEVDQPSSSPNFLTMRKQGVWRPMCDIGCKKGDLSVFLEKRGGELTLDFRFKTFNFKEEGKPISLVGRCETI